MSRRLSFLASETQRNDFYLAMLRVLQEKEFGAVGDSTTVRVDVLVVAITKRSVAACTSYQHNAAISPCIRIAGRDRA